MYNNQTHRIINQPIELYWAGWRATTYDLGREGWQLSANQDVYRNQISLAINHPQYQVQGFSAYMPFDYRRMIENGIRGNITLPSQLKFDLARVIHFQGSPNITEFSPIGFIPEIMEMKIHSLNDLAHFSTVQEEAKHQVFLHEASMNQILEMALSKQEPEQEAIRREMIHRQEMQRYRRGTLHTELRLVA